jgi:hypothetical protein
MGSSRALSNNNGGEGFMKSTEVSSGNAHTHHAHTHHKHHHRTHGRHKKPVSTKVPDTVQEHLRIVREREGDIKLPKEFMNCLDIDGDGVIDVEEMALIRELEEMDLNPPDIDGDGHVSSCSVFAFYPPLTGAPLIVQVDESELRLAKIRAGRSLMATRFVSRQGPGMYRYGPEYCKATPEECVERIANNKYFSALMNQLKFKERVLR